eukprot:GILK01005648.1.p1 GENE.GILK01005648.1~~GILK01005648.1.p1  ORF type:complete len:278 (-),score=33.61 GILK01005648.1:375-1208(-)
MASSKSRAAGKKKAKVPAIHESDEEDEAIQPQVHPANIAFIRNEVPYQYGEACRFNSSSEHPFIGAIAEVGKSNNGETCVRCYWYYRPEETKSGLQPHHGDRELLLSDHADWNSIDSIEKKCVVLPFEHYKKLTFVGPDTYYFRQEYAHRTGGFIGELPRYCICRQPENPDRTMVGCDKCGEWYHPLCIGLNVPDDKLETLDFICDDCNGSGKKMKRSVKRKADARKVAAAKSATKLAKKRKVDPQAGVIQAKKIKPEKAVSQSSTSSSSRKLPNGR